MQTLTLFFQRWWILFLRMHVRLGIFVRRLQFNLILALSSILAFASFSMMIYTDQEFVEDIAIMIDEKIDAHSEVTTQKILKFIENLEGVEKSCALLLQGGSARTLEKRERLFMNLFERCPQISSISVIDAQGESARLTYRQYGSQSLILSNAPFVREYCQKGVCKTVSLTEQGSVLSQKTVSSLVYDDPRLLGWYLQAKELQKPFLHDLSVLNDQSIGIKIVAPFFAEKSQKFLGAIALEVPILSFSSLLEVQSLSKMGVSCIADMDGQILAHPNLSQTFKLGLQGLVTKSIFDLSSDLFRKGFKHFQKTGKQRLIYQKDQSLFYDTLLVIPLKKIAGQDSIWAKQTLVMSFMGDYLSAPIQQARQDMFFFSWIIIIISITIVLTLSKALTQPIIRIAGYLKQLQNMDFSIRFDHNMYFYELFQTVEGLKGLTTTLQAFSRFVPKSLVKQLFFLKQESVLGGDRKTLTILFSDIQNFTSITEKLDGETLMRHLSDYFDALTRVIQERHGTIDKYIGDAIMAFWGAPLMDPKQAVRACQAALLCQRRLQILNPNWEAAGKPALVSRFGINTGEVIVGNIGSYDRFQYTVLGDDVNLAARLEGLNKFYGTRILISASTYGEVKDRFIIRPVDKVIVKGKQDGKCIYELLGELGDTAGDDGSLLIDLALRTEEAFNFYQDRQWGAALRRYQYIARDFNGDPLSQVFIKRCINFLKTPPDPEWDGSYQMTEK